MKLTTEEQLAELPVGSVVKCHWTDGSQHDYTAMRCPVGGASYDGYAVISGYHWVNIANWGADVTLLYRAEP